MEDPTISSEPEAIKEHDNLHLTDIYINNIPEDIIFPDELNQYLQGQIQFLLHTKGMLERKLSENEDTINEKSKMISKLTIKVAQYEQFTQGSEGIVSSNPVHLMSAKIIELSKKLKDRTVETESLKTKFSKIQQQLTTLQNNNSKVGSKSDGNENFATKNENTDPTEAIPKKNYLEDIKSLQEKLSQTTNKLFDVKNKNIELKNEIKSANRILHQELGEQFKSIQNFVSSQSNWRGRAQQIIHLQQKNTELQDKITILSLNVSTTNLPPKTDSKKFIIEQLEKEANNFRLDLEETRKKLSISKARIKVLENENSSLKVKTISMTCKSDNDEKIMLTLKTQIKNLEETNSEMDKVKQLSIKKLEDQIQNLKSDIERNNFVIENLRKALEEKNKKIKDLQNENINRVNSATFNESRVSSSGSGRTDQNKLQVLEVERTRLLELVEVLNARLKDERAAHAATQINYKKERQRAAKMETKISRIELENSFNSSHVNSYSKSMCKLNSPQSNVDTSSNVSYENIKNKFLLMMTT